MLAIRPSISTFPTMKLLCFKSAAAALTLTLALAGCGEKKPTIVLYSDQAQSIVDPMVKQFEQERGVAVKVIYAAPKDVQSGVGLSTQLRQESASPQADIYWACSPQAISKLRGDGLLQTQKDAFTTQLAPTFQGSDWFGLGVKVRVLLYNTRLVSSAHVPKSIASLAQPAWKGKGAMADPRTNGSARYHLLGVFAVLQEEEGTKLLHAMKDNGVQFLPNEAAVVNAVAEGKASWGVVDSDVALEAVNAKKPVRFAVTDQEPFSTSEALGKDPSDVPTLGTPLLPLPLALIKNGPTKGSYALLDFLLTTRNGTRLAENQPNLLPTHQALLDNLKSDEQALNPLTVKTLPLKPEALADVEPQFNNALRDVLGE